MTHPFPFVKHPFKKASQAVFAVYIYGASVQTSGLQTFDPALAMHGPSEPIIPKHPLIY